jgi:hypothetical protein
MDTIVDRVSGGEDEHRGLDASVPERAEDFEAIAPWKHQVEDDEVEEFRVRPEEALLAGLGDDHLVVLALESFLEGSGHLRLVFDDQDLHITPRCRIAVIFSQNATILKGARSIGD